MKLTAGAEAAWMIAAGEAASAGHPRIEPAHLLIGVLSLDKLNAATDGPVDSNAARVRDESARLLRALAASSLDPRRLRRRARTQLGRGPAEGPPSGPLSRSLTSKAIFAAAEALAGDAHPVGVAHLLCALAEDVDVVTARIVREGGTDLARLRAALREAGRTVETPAPETPPPELVAPDSRTPSLDRFGRDLTALSRRGELGPVIGRRREILAVLQSLARSAPTSPVLVGDAGVGKTAVVEAIAARGAEGKDPVVLGGKRIVEVSLGALLGGAESEGVAEERVREVIAEARANSDVIVFFDDLQAGGGGTGPRAVDAGDLLKPALAQGELRCIGATTADGYRRLVESDPALERRLEKVPVAEPDRDEALEILRGLRPQLERHHAVSLPDEALAAAVDLSVRFEPDRKLPEKAIDLLDKAAARTRLPVPSLLHPPADREDEEVPEAPPVTPLIVARVLAEKRRLPLDLVAESLDDGMGTRLLALEGFLRERVIGQEEAIARVSRRLRLAFGSPRGGERPGPMAVLLFLGPSGVGKTETARLLAEHLFGSASGMIRIDMSELREERDVSKLLGPPPGSAGPDDEGRLTGAVRTKPHALLLLDEVEKAHPRVLDVFLRLFDEGHVTDSKGRTADARSLVVVMTSNLGGPGRVDGPTSGATLAPSAPADPRSVIRLDLLNRVDEIVTFRALDPDDVQMIVGRALAELTSAVERRHGVRVRMTPEAAGFAARQAALSAPGARGARRTVERLVHGPLSALVLTGKLTRHTAWVAVYDEGGIYLLPEG
ncbi:MAG TPA: ATP-dependent Clp protease ATP-binding subunit [Vicinamibacteria bacterium]|nr:ATP-dependent Clp protease ATP-binding subunit [Vicinamibacteria bacterium]